MIIVSIIHINTLLDGQIIYNLSNTIYLTTLICKFLSGLLNIIMLWEIRYEDEQITCSLHPSFIPTSYFFLEKNSFQKFKYFYKCKVLHNQLNIYDYYSFIFYSIKFKIIQNKLDLDESRVAFVIMHGLVS